MNTKFVATASVEIKASADKVWDALTNPSIIRQYLFGTTVDSTWKVGAPITYSGEWQGKPYKDKGTILEIVPRKRLSSTYWSSIGGLPDEPSSYSTVTYELEHAGGTTKLTLTQDNNSSKESAEHSTSNWELVLNSMKKILES